MSGGAFTTSLGLKLRALSERPTTAELNWIPARPLSVAVWAATGVVSTLVISLVAPSQSNDATSLAMLVISAAAAALLGGFRRLNLAVVGGLVVCGLVLHALQRGGWGSAWESVAFSERGTASAGASVPRSKLTAFAVSAALGGISGG